MKIAMVGQKGIPAAYGGVERHVEELSHELGLLGYQVIVYARRWFTFDQPTTHHEGVTVKHLPTLHTKHFDTIFHTLLATLHAMFVARVDVIHFHGVGPSLLSWIPRVFSPRIKVIATFHCIDRYHKKWGAIARWFLRLGEYAACRFPHRTIAVSKTIQKYALNEYHSLLSYIPNGVQPTKASGGFLLKNFGLKRQRYVLMVSRLVPHKGAHYLLAAWQYALKRQPELAKEYKLVIVGGSTFSSEYVETLKTMAEQDETVIFTGWQQGEALAELYEHAAFLVHPSENEGLPITVLQAMAHRKAALISDIPEHQELVNDNRFLFKNTSVVALTDKILALLASPHLVEEAGAYNQELVRKHFDWNAIALQTARLYAMHSEDMPVTSELLLAEHA
jgi:glycosyltransferase involved in cell wall biosynthesis